MKLNRHNYLFGFSAAVTLAGYSSAQQSGRAAEHHPQQLRHADEDTCGGVPGVSISGCALGLCAISGNVSH